MKIDGFDIPQELFEAAREFAESRAALSDQTIDNDFPMGIPKFVDFDLLSSKRDKRTDEFIKKNMLLKNLKSAGFLNHIARRSKLLSPITDKQKKILFSLSRREIRSVSTVENSRGSMFLCCLDYYFISQFMNSSKHKYSGKPSQYAFSLPDPHTDLDDLSEDEKKLYILLLQTENKAYQNFLLEPMLLDIWRTISNSEINIEGKKEAVNAFFGISSYLNQTAFISLLGYCHRDVYDYYLGDSLYTVYSEEGTGELIAEPFSDVFESLVDFFSEMNTSTETIISSLILSVKNSFFCDEDEYSLKDYPDLCDPEYLTDADLGIRFLKNRLDLIRQFIDDAKIEAHLDDFEIAMGEYELVISEHDSVLSGEAVVLPDDKLIKKCFDLSISINKTHPSLNAVGFTRKSLDRAISNIVNVSDMITNFGRDVSSDRDSLIALSKDTIGNIGKISKLSESISNKYSSFTESIVALSNDINADASITLDNLNDLLPECSVDSAKAITVDNDHVLSLEKTISDLEALISDSDSELSEMKHRFLQMEESISAERSQIYEQKINKTKNGMTEPVRAIMTQLVADPSKCSLENQLLAVSALYPDSVVVLPNAIESSRISDYENRALSWSYLQTLCCDYLTAINSGKPDSEARQVFPIKVYAANESVKARSPGPERDARSGFYNDKKYTFEKHLRLGSEMATRKTMRIHFDVIDEKLVIFHFGIHLG